MANKENNVTLDNTALKEALTTLKNERTVAHEQVMFTELKKAHVLTPVMFSVPINNQGGSFKLPKGAKIKYVLIHTKDGKAFFPAFTDIEEAKKLNITQGESVQYIVRTLKDYDMIVNDKNNNTSGIALNPMSDNIVLPTELVNRLNRGTEVKPTVNVVPQEVRYTEPNVYPTAVVNAVYDKCVELQSVNRVWLKGMVTGMMMGYCLFVEADKVDETLCNTLKEVAEKESKGVSVEVKAVDKKIMETVIKDAVALYDKDLEF